MQFQENSNILEWELTQGLVWKISWIRAQITKLVDNFISKRGNIMKDMTYLNKDFLYHVPHFTFTFMVLLMKDMTYFNKNFFYHDTFHLNDPAKGRHHINHHVSLNPQDWVFFPIVLLVHRVPLQCSPSSLHQLIRGLRP